MLQFIAMGPSCGTNEIKGLAGFRNSRKSLVTRQLQFLETVASKRRDQAARALPAATSKL
jgi:hypothetical protein